MKSAAQNLKSSERTLPGRFSKNEDKTKYVSDINAESYITNRFTLYEMLKAIFQVIGK